MCGFAGFINFNHSTKLDSTAVIKKMTDSLVHRGPDDSGIWVEIDERISMGHHRLSILDLSPSGHQPMHSLSNRYVIIFNGEIYNHLEIRALLELESSFSGVWIGTSDTETLLASIDFWGLDQTLQLCVGMFAFALWDRSKHILTLARDRLGEKPLYYGWINNAFVFGSELKALKAHPDFTNSIDRKSLADYLRFNYVPAPQSIYEDIYKLEPGCFIETSIDSLKERQVKSENFWSLSSVIKKSSAYKIQDEAEGLLKLEEQLKQTIKMQMLSDVPLGAFLSGGVDSSLIVSLMQEQSSKPIETFTVGFENSGFDESPHAKKVAQYLRTDHNELFVTSKEAREVIPLLPTIYDEPFADPSQIPTYLVCQAARRNVTVALSGDAGDELFGGYNRYFWGPRIWSKVAWLPYSSRRMLGKAISMLTVEGWDALGSIFNSLRPGTDGIASLGDKVYKLSARLDKVDSVDDLYLSLVTEWQDIASLVKNPGGVSIESNALNFHDSLFQNLEIHDAASRMMFCDTLTYLPDDILCKVDRAAMANSLETRVPFLDHRILELAWQLPDAMKIRGKEGKWALRQILYKYVPRELIERPKAGFGIPVGDWLRGPLKSWAEDLLDPARIDEEGFLYAQPIQEIWQQHLSCRYDWTPRLWSVLMFQAWLEQQ